MQKKPEIDLKRFRNHKRNIPWGLIRKLIIGTATILLLFYFIRLMEEAQEAQEAQEKSKEIPTEIEVDIES